MARSRQTRDAEGLIVPKKVGKSFTQHESDFTMQLVKDIIIDKNFD